MIRLLKYIFWTLRYLFAAPDKDFTACMKRLKRTWWPWRKFSPYVWHNDDGRFWEIYLSDEQDYTDTGWTVRVDLCIGMDTGKIVGMKISDHVLKRLAAEVAEVRNPTKPKYIRVGEQAMKEAKVGELPRCLHGNGVCCPECQSENDRARENKTEKG